MFLLVLCATPPMPLVYGAVFSPSTEPIWTPAFSKALLNGLMLGVGVTSVSLLLGLPLGLLTALYRFPGRRGLGLVQALPLLLPSFLSAIGWSNLAARGWLPTAIAPSGPFGTIFVLGLQAFPLPLFLTWVACQNLTQSQIEVARLHGGE